MQKFVRRLLVAVALLAITVGAVASYLLQDPNRFKPQLQSLIEAQSGVPVTIGGDLGWHLWPPISITAEDVSADYQGQKWQIGRISLDLDAVAALRDPSQWRVQSLTVDDVNMRQQGSVLSISQAKLRDLAPGRPAPISAHLTYTAEGQAPVPVDVDGRVSIDPATSRLALANTRVEMPYAQGTCDVQTEPTAHAAKAPPATDADLIPVDVFRGYSWSGKCALDWLAVNGKRFENVAVDLGNHGGDSALTARLPKFFGGQAVMKLAIDARATPVRWTLTPTLTGVDSQALMAWLDQPLHWVSQLAYGGSLSFEGNTAAELAASMSGDTRFNGGQGRIDISAIRSQLLNLASLFNEGQRIRGWPEMWDYQRFVGDWHIDHQHHTLEASLDNLSLTAQGDYHPASNDMNMLLTLVFHRNPALPVFDLNPLLYDLPIPVRCKGALDAPTCRVDDKVAQRVVAAALNQKDSALRTKLEKKIDKEVPAQYRDAARSLLDALGSSLQDHPQDQPKDH